MPALALCILVGLAAAQTRDNTPDPGPNPATELTIDISKNHVAIKGVVSSAEHESILRRVAKSLFADKPTTLNLQEKPALPPGWALVTELALRAAAQTYSSTTRVTPSAIDIHGVTGNVQAWHENLSRLEHNRLPDMKIDYLVSELSPNGSLERHCISLFRQAQRGRQIAFQRAQATLSTNAVPLLDALLQIAVDCPTATVVITGHTDNTGDEAGNESLSQARADAIADYMLGHGLSATRITALGAGSSQPLVAEDTRQAHQLNRRIEIELIFPET